MSETSQAHKAKAPKKFGFAVIVCSTTRCCDFKAGKHVNDESGDLIVKLLEANGHSVISRDLIADESKSIKASVKRALLSNEIDAIITSGGTGITPSDVTIETVAPLLEKQLPGFGELLRGLSYDHIGSAAVITRAIAGVVQRRVVFCIPGSPNAVKLCLEKLILPEVGHIIFHAREK